MNGNATTGIVLGIEIGQDLDSMLSFMGRSLDLLAASLFNIADRMMKKAETKDTTAPPTARKCVPPPVLERRIREGREHNTRRADAVEHGFSHQCTRRRREGEDLGRELYKAFLDSETYTLIAAATKRQKTMESLWMEVQKQAERAPIMNAFIAGLHAGAKEASNEREAQRQNERTEYTSEVFLGLVDMRYRVVPEDGTYKVRLVTADNLATPMNPKVLGLDDDLIALFDQSSYAREVTEAQLEHLRENLRILHCG